MFFNNPAWSLSCEAFFYLVFPFVLLRLKPRTFTGVLIAMTAFWLSSIAVPLIAVAHYPSPSPGSDAGVPGEMLLAIRRLPILALPEFLCGISLGWLYLRFKPSARTATWLLASGGVTLLASLLASPWLPDVALNNGLLLPPFACIILGLCYPNWLTRLLSHSALVLLGEASFAMYLLHGLMLELTRRSTAWPSFLTSLSGWLLSVVAGSVLLHLFVERPGRRIILGWYSRRHPPEMKLIPGPTHGPET